MYPWHHNWDCTQTHDAHIGWCDFCLADLTQLLLCSCQDDLHAYLMHTPEAGTAVASPQNPETAHTEMQLPANVRSRSDHLPRESAQEAKVAITAAVVAMLLLLCMLCRILAWRFWLFTGCKTEVCLLTIGLRELPLLPCVPTCRSIAKTDPIAL